MFATLIKSRAGYDACIREMLESVKQNHRMRESEQDRFDFIALLAEDYEKRKWPIHASDPVESIKFRMKQRGLKQRDLVPYIGLQNRVSEVLSGKRRLTLPMIRALSDGLGIPASVLIQPSGPDR